MNTLFERPAHIHWLPGHYVEGGGVSREDPSGADRHVQVHHEGYILVDRNQAIVRMYIVISSRDQTQVRETETRYLVVHGNGLTDTDVYDSAHESADTICVETLIELQEKGNLALR